MEQNQKLLYFKYFFVGRDDVYAVRQHDGKYQFKRAPLTNNLIIRHIRGERFIGSYPLQRDGTTRWAAADFDNKNGNAFEQAKILVDAFRNLGIEPLCNTSQSGKGVHVRLIFAGPSRDVMTGHDVLASVARRFMKSVVEYAELKGVNDGGAFDRIFPSGDNLLSDQSVGTQIAMPLNKFAADDRGGTMLLDREFKKIPLGDATWEKIELYDWVGTGDIFDAVCFLGKQSFVYGAVNEHGKRIYEDTKFGTIKTRNNDGTCKNTIEDLKFVLDNCNFMRRVASEIEIPYSMWFVLASVLASFDDVDGRSEFHRISKLDKSLDKRGHYKYDPVKTDGKYNNALATMRSPVTCQTMADMEVGWRCKYLGKDGMCDKFRRSDGRGAKTPATIHVFAPRVRGTRNAA